MDKEKLIEDLTKLGEAIGKSTNEMVEDVHLLAGALTVIASGGPGRTSPSEYAKEVLDIFDKIQAERVTRKIQAETGDSNG